MGKAGVIGEGRISGKTKAMEKKGRRKSKTRGETGVKETWRGGKEGNRGREHA